MIEFVLKNRRLRLHPDGVMYVRAISYLGEETMSGRIWKEVKFSKGVQGYFHCNITLNRVQRVLTQHRLVYYAHHQDWDIFDGSRDNLIDHINRKRDDNRIENLHVVNQQQNGFNTDAKGYYWNKRDKKWTAQIKLNNKKHFLGSFENEEDAHNAYLEGKAKYHVIAALPIPGHAAPMD